MTRNWISVPLLAAALCIALADGASAQPAHVRVGPVSKETVAPEHRVTGSLRALQEAVIAAREEGALLTVPYREAQAVQANQVLATIDKRRLEAAISEVDAEVLMAKAQLAEREAELLLRERDLEALEAALEKKAVAERDVRSARMDVSVAKAKIQSAKANIESLGQKKAVLALRRDDTTVHAPFDGRITARHVEPGEWIRPGEPIVTMISEGRIEAWLDVPERFAEHTAGDAIPVRVLLEPSGRHLPTLRARRLPRVHEKARTFPLIVEVDDEKGRLVPGMSVSAHVQVAAPALHTLVPKDALVRRADGVSVFRVRREGEQALAEQLPVAWLFDTQEHSAVEGPLAEGDLLVVEGNERLRGGQPLVVLDAHKAGANGGTSK